MVDNSQDIRGIADGHNFIHTTNLDYSVAYVHHELTSPWYGLQYQGSIADMPADRALSSDADGSNQDAMYSVLDPVSAMQMSHQAMCPVTQPFDEPVNDMEYFDTFSPMSALSLSSSQPVDTMCFPEFSTNMLGWIDLTTDPYFPGHHPEIDQSFVESLAQVLADMPLDATGSHHVQEPAPGLQFSAAPPCVSTTTSVSLPMPVPSSSSPDAARASRREVDTAKGKFSRTLVPVSEYQTGTLFSVPPGFYHTEQRCLQTPSSLAPFSSHSRSPSLGYPSSETESAYTADTAYTDQRCLAIVSPGPRRPRQQSEPRPAFSQGAILPHMGNARRSSQSAARHRLARIAPYAKPSQDRPGRALSSVLHPRRERGKRSRQLSPRTRDEANRKRMDRSVCIGCKISKIRCERPEDTVVCSKCRHTNEVKPFVCVPAHFFDHVRKTSLIMLGENAIDYTDGNGSCYAGIELPSIIDMVSLIQKVSEFSHRCNIRVGQNGSDLYDLDLRLCHSYLRSLGPPERHTMREYVDKLTLDKDGTWRQCINDATGLMSHDKLCEALIRFCERPSRFTFSLVGRAGADSTSARVLDPSRPGDEEALHVAVRLVLILGRKLELAAYHSLQMSLMGHHTVEDHTLYGLRLVVLSLRRRLSLMQQAQTPGLKTYGDDDDEHEQLSPVERADKLCQILYVYYCFLSRRTSYHDRERGSNELSAMESWDGYGRWMQEGRLSLNGEMPLS